jgi:hypothetical protein
MQVRSTKLAKVLFVLIMLIILFQDLVSKEKSGNRRGREEASCGETALKFCLVVDAT